MTLLLVIIIQERVSAGSRLRAAETLSCLQRNVTFDRSGV